MYAEKMAFYKSLKAIFLHIDNAEKAFLSQFRLSVPRFYTLYHIYNHPGINYIDLTDLLLCTKSNTTRIVRSLQKEGLIDRKNHPDDGRSFQLFLTDAGKDLYERIYPQYLAHINWLMSHFTDAELNRYSLVSYSIENTLAEAILGGNSGQTELPSRTAQEIQEQSFPLNCEAEMSVYQGEKPNYSNLFKGE
ncbi:MAG: MarR family transcriptional regulator [Anaerolineaceae bacterium]|nr:MarR family transcriptional regulator [Anaerolineaceae bacterium]